MKWQTTPQLDADWKRPSPEHKHLFERLVTKTVAYDWLRTVAMAEKVPRLGALAAPRAIVLQLCCR